MASDMILDDFDFQSNFQLINQIFDLRHEKFMLQLEVDKLKLFIQIEEELKEVDEIIENWSV